MAVKLTDITEELIASLHEAAAVVQGEAEPARIHLPPDVPSARVLLMVIDRSPEIVAQTVAEAHARKYILENAWGA